MHMRGSNPLKWARAQKFSVCPPEGVRRCARNGEGCSVGYLKRTQPILLPAANECNRVYRAILAYWRADGMIKHVMFVIVAAFRLIVATFCLIIAAFFLDQISSERASFDCHLDGGKYHEGVDFDSSWLHHITISRYGINDLTYNLIGETYVIETHCDTHCHRLWRITKNILDETYEIDESHVEESLDNKPVSYSLHGTCRKNS